ncbi:UDP-N-acetylmuramoyl-L-alanyl-D-glutamate--2,6-diaminopimelate ligase [Gracilibacillus caseinilyticus]|uniref:UDP-N-acetylmuramoyl-L-alanyl-D-glutamate--2,6-diaminopimelate ligase n=1 Tax=Gracilibacillus caseinilyticus TaxID=2932256 RepID=A0ABY4EU65_9BACI|nr:UDP-N-acetylmuramoyl-L-alanyl-D-glutamate--2,6-diaminopimelate ligase [Gracilibacillus caseinilyticus]UOQ47962.1 UDP-N-acetylmuramoyl-L-alanyl-D-glutamate--2,6-diaminopimelate ligase [Gracilibacillus caseinilyticus]
MNAKQLINVLPDYTCTNNIESIEIEQIEMDNRQIKTNALFVCIKGYTNDGHEYAAAAVESGAKLIVAERELNVSVPVVIVPDTSRALAQLANTFYQQPSKRMNVIGVTGTNGKTSVTHIIDQIQQQATKKTALIGTIKMTIDKTVYEVKNTTPDALFLQNSFQKMVDQAIDVCTMEVSSHALDLGRVHGVDFNIAVFTNLSQDHLDYHESMESYLHAKSLLFSQLGNTFDEKQPKYAIINEDDANATFLKKATAQPVLTYGVKHNATFQAVNVKLMASGVSFTLKTPEGDVLIESKLMGMFSVYNLLAAAAASYAAGIELTTIQAVLNATSGVKGRFQPVEHSGDFGVIVDYAHTPDSLENVLTTIKCFCEGTIHVVVGCGGDRDRRKRPLMAEVACKYADNAIFTADNPRSESPQAILEDMVDNLSYENYQIVPDRETAIKQAIEQANDKDVVLIAGKGHETYQIVGDQVLDFDDEQVAKKYLSE